MFLTNAFSINMLDPEHFHRIDFRAISIDEVRELLAGDFKTDPIFFSAVGHESTAQVLTARLGMDIPFHRQNIKIARGACMIVAQASVPRLAEGQLLSEEEMKNIPITFWMLSSQEDPE